MLREKGKGRVIDADECLRDEERRGECENKFVLTPQFEGY